MRLDRRRQYVVVSGQRHPHLVRIRLPPARRTLHIRKDKRDSARRSVHGRTVLAVSPQRQVEPNAPGPRRRVRFCCVPNTRACSSDPLALVDVASVTERHDYDEQDVIVD